MQKVINRKNVALCERLDATGMFELILDTMNFQPDAVCVKQIQYRNNPAAPESLASFIFTSLVNGPIGSFFDGSNSDPNITYPLQSFTQGTTHRFRVISSTGATDVTRSGALCIHLEFIEYEKPHPSTAPANIFK